MVVRFVVATEIEQIQSNLDYLDLDYLDYSIIRTFFSDPVFHEY